MRHGTLRYEPFPDRAIFDVAEDAHALAMVTKEAIAVRLNGIAFDVLASDTLDSIVKKYTGIHRAWQPPKKPRGNTCKKS